MTAQVSDVAREVSHRRILGNCKWFDGARGFGFIEGQDGREYFVHQSSIISKGWRNLEVNQEVEFEVIIDNDKLKAVNVSPRGGIPVKGEQRKHRNPCFAYKKGTCIYGNSCKFYHALQSTVNPSHAGRGSTYGRNIPRSRGHNYSTGVVEEQVKRGVCYSWRRGECYRGEMCRFDHPPQEKDRQLFNTSKAVCYQWQEGTCNKGESCQFAHFPTE